METHQFNTMLDLREYIGDMALAATVGECRGFAKRIVRRCEEFCSAYHGEDIAKLMEAESVACPHFGYKRVVAGVCKQALDAVTLSDDHARRTALFKIKRNCDSYTDEQLQLIMKWDVEKFS